LYASTGVEEHYEKRVIGRGEKEREKGHEGEIYKKKPL